MIDPFVFIVVLVVVLGVGAYIGWKQYQKDREYKLYVLWGDVKIFVVPASEVERFKTQVDQAISDAFLIPKDLWE